MIKEESQYLRVAMGHEEESLDEFVEAHKTCLNDLMYLPTWVLMVYQASLTYGETCIL